MHRNFGGILGDDVRGYQNMNNASGMEKGILESLVHRHSKSIRLATLQVSETRSCTKEEEGTTPLHPRS